MAPKKVHLPNKNDIQKIFNQLTTSSVEVADTNQWKHSNLTNNYIAIYNDDNHQLSAIGIIDLQLGAAIAASLTKIPSSRIKEVISEGKLDEILEGNLGEVLNICASLLNKDDYRHVVFRGLEQASSAKSKIEPLLNESIERIDVQLNIPNYSKGNLTFIVSTG